jgi:hypothetical protein
MTRLLCEGCGLTWVNNRGECLGGCGIAHFTEGIPRRAEWISVEDKMPPDGKLVIIKGGVGLHTEAGWYSTVDYGTYRPEKITGWEVTHWMPLPDPPRER